MKIDERIIWLVDYAQEAGLIKGEDRIYSINRILEVLERDEFDGSGDAAEDACLETVLGDLVGDAVNRGVLEDDIVSRDLFDTKIMGCLVPRPSEVISRFWSLYEDSPKAATKYYYQLSQDTDYIRRYRIIKDMKWIAATEYGNLDITINLSKPEKDPKAIAAALKAKSSAYPKCLLCKENEGYAGRPNHPARQNHRVIPLTMNDQPWYLQYSPYVYYNEHCIVFNGEHTPMKIDRYAFVKLFDFVKQFPHYFVGSNADLPIVGGSILTHDHFQGGHYQFAMAKAPVERAVVFKGYEDVEAGVVKWPMSVIRIRSGETKRLIDLADKILSCWRSYSDPEAVIFAETDGVPHNTITPIARMANGKYELDLVLRNNLTTEAYPDGLYHPHPEYHHIKKENIGLIEVMGLAVLPARLKTEMAQLKDCLLAGKDVNALDNIKKHAQWSEFLKDKYTEMNATNIDKILQDEVGFIYAKILEQAGVYKRNHEGQAAFVKFIDSVK